MRDCFELVDISIYLVGVGLILPATQAFGRDSIWSIAILVILIAPIPGYLARFKYSFPDRIDSAFETYAHLVFFAGLLVLLGVGGMAGFRWLSPAQRIGRTTWFLRQAYGTPSNFGNDRWPWYSLSQSDLLASFRAMSQKPSVV